MVKCLPPMWENQVRSLGQEDPLENEMATHSSVLAWKIPWTEEPGGLLPIGSQRVRHDWVTSLSSFLFQKIIIELPCYPAVSLLRIYTKESNSKFQRDIHTPIFVATLFTIPKHESNLRKQGTLGTSSEIRKYRKRRATWYIYVIKTVKFLQVDSGIVFARERQGKEDSISQTARTFSYKRWISPRDLLFSMVTTVNILYYMLKIC